MKATRAALFFAAVLLCGCTTNTVPLYKDYTPFETFLRDREECVRDAQACVTKAYAQSYYEGLRVHQLLPSRGVYLACMTSRGYYAAANGFVPPALVKMTDYPRGQDCFGK